MKETVAENRFVLTKELFDEGMRRVWWDGGGRSVKMLLAALCLVWLALTAFTLLRGGSFAMPLVELLILALVILWAAVWLPRGRTRQAWRAMESRGAAEAERSVCFCEDRLTLQTAGQEKSLAYGEIVRILHSRRLLILIAEDKTGILVKKDSFVSGSEDEVLRRIEQYKEEHSND